jgi:hypothetical protein
MPPFKCHSGSSFASGLSASPSHQAELTKFSSGRLRHQTGSCLASPSPNQETSTSSPPKPQPDRTRPHTLQRPTRPAMDMESPAERRLARVTAHLAPSFPLPAAPAIAPSPTASASSPAADTYSRVHGDVSSEPPEWRAATDDSGKPFVDIIYEKAVGEGIAKV